MKKSRKAILCHIAAAVCFGMVSYGHLYRGRMGLGWIFAIIAAMQVVLAVTGLMPSRS
ncbi:MAG: hypothetical protein PUC00_04785 [Clostridiales bacterium]|nr:hypothetical protein [Clostridiales bacterium]